jgi:hypothetical protein
MLFFLLGVLALLVLMGALGAFSRAQVTSIRDFGFWGVAIGGLILSVLLLFTRPTAGFASLLLIGPLLWSWKVSPRGRPRSPRGTRRRPVAPGGPMSREEAYQVLGLRPGASEAEIRAAHHRLMRAAHPDAGGSDWLAARINQARDVLLAG